MREQIRKILEMLEAGKTTAAQAEELLEAIGVFDMQMPALPKGKGGSSHLLRVNVKSHDGDKINVKIPLRLASAGINIAKAVGKGKAAALDGVNLEEVMLAVDEMLEAGETGEIVNVESSDGDVVHIVLE